MAIGDSNSFLNADWDPSFALSLGGGDDLARRLRAADDLLGSHSSALSAAYAAIVASGETWTAPSVGRTVLAGDGDDTVIGSSGDDRVEGGAGRDVLVGGPGSDRLIGGDGDDMLIGALLGAITPSHPLFAQLSLANQLYGNAGDDVLVGGPGNDYLDGGTGDDLVMGMLGADTLLGGAGNNIIFGDYGSTPTTDPYSVYQAYSKQIGFNDTINAGNGDDVAFGGLGDDTVDGGTGRDILYGGVGRDTIYGGAGDDVVYGDYQTASGAPTGGWDKAVPSWMFDDHIYGGAGSDVLFGGIGNDVLSGGAGRDLLVGGVGDDTYVFSRGDGIDVIRDMIGAGDGGDNTLAVYGRAGNEGVEANEVSFVNNGAGQWTLAFNDGSGSISFSAADIGTISLHSADITTYAWDDASQAYGLVAA